MTEQDFDIMHKLTNPLVTKLADRAVVECPFIVKLSVYGSAKTLSVRVSHTDFGHKCFFELVNDEDKAFFENVITDKYFIYDYSALMGAATIIRFAKESDAMAFKLAYG